VLSLIALFAAIRGVKKDTPEIGMDRFDLPGNLLFILSIGAVIYGLTAFNQNAAGKAVLAGGLILLVVFVLQERKAKEPMMDLTLFTSDAAFTLSNLTALFNYAGTFAVGYMMSIYLQVVNGYSAQTAGILLITQPLFMTLLSPVMGRLSDRIAPYKLASLGMALCAAALLFFALLRPEVPIAGIVAALAVTGTGVAMFSPPNTNIIMSCVPPAKYGIANSILSTMRTVGHATGMAVITLVTSAIVGNISLYDADPAKLLSTIHIAFAIFCATSAAGIFMSLKRRNI
jgi:predicted MFS family arabinose efflux permease